MNELEISVVVPVYNEEGNLSELSRRLKETLEGLQVTYEIIFVNDGSRDRSLEILQELHQANSDNIKVISFSRNFGHHIAVTAGIDHSQGNSVVLMDADLQDPPEEIPKLYEKFKEGYDVAYAVRKVRNDPIMKRISSSCFHALFKVLAKVDISPDYGIFRIMSRPAVDALKACRERSRFITALISWTGFSHIGVDTKRDARYAGETKYSMVKSILLAANGITSFSYFPLRLATYLGCLVAFISFVAGIYMLLKKLLFDIAVMGYASVIISVLFIGGVQLIITGIMGEYIGRIYTEVQDRPIYLIKEKLGFDQGQNS